MAHLPFLPGYKSPFPAQPRGLLHRAPRDAHSGIDWIKLRCLICAASSGDSWWIAALWLVVGLITATQVVVGMAAVGMRLNWIASSSPPSLHG